MDRGAPERHRVQINLYLVVAFWRCLIIDNHSHTEEIGEWIWAYQRGCIIQASDLLCDRRLAFDALVKEEDAHANKDTLVEIFLHTLPALS